jgi:hypothetical protein
MESINLGKVIEEAIEKFGRNRIGEKPPVFVTISAALSTVPWPDRRLKEFVRLFLYESFLTSDPDAAIEVTLRRQAHLRDLNDFVGVHPSYWTQLRVSGRGLKVMEPLIEELFSHIGYDCEEWVGVEASNTRLGIFAPVDHPDLKMVFGLEMSRHILKCDLLLPISETYPLSTLLAHDAKNAVPRT